MHYQFQKDLKDGASFEEEVTKLLKGYLDDFVFITNKTKEYDILVSDTFENVSNNSKNVTFEVKNDLMATKTGNVAIEYECRGEESGLVVTTADWWVHGIDGIPYFITVDKLREICLLATKKVIGGDKGSSTKLYLIKIDDFKKHCINMNEVIDDIKKIFKVS